MTDYTEMTLTGQWVRCQWGIDACTSEDWNQCVLPAGHPGPHVTRLQFEREHDVGSVTPALIREIVREEITRALEQQR